MSSWTLRFLAPVVLALASLPAGAYAASTGPSSSYNSVTVTTDPVTDLSTTGDQSHARFNGRIDLENAGVEYFFRYAVDTGGTFDWTNQTATQEDAAPNTAKTVVATDTADDLEPNTTYRIRLVAKLADGTLRRGDLVSFTTPTASSNSGSGSGSSGSGSGSSGSGSGTNPNAIGRRIDPVSSLTPTSATLNGRITPNGNATHWQFLYKKTDAVSGFVWAPSPSAPGVVASYYDAAQEVTGLTPSTSYDVQLTATIDGSSTIYYSQTLTFTTPASQPEPTPEPDPTPDPTPEPDPTPDPDPTPEPDPTPDPTPTPEPDPSPTTDPSPTPSTGSDTGSASKPTTSTTPDAAPTTLTTPLPAAQSTTPQVNQSAGVAPASGTVMVKEPGTGRYTALKAGDVIPMGSVVDTRRGTVALTTALPSGTTQTGYFSGGEFQVKQGRGGYADLFLRGPVCRPAPKRKASGASASAVARGAGKSGRRLFGRDKGGKFRTHGRNSHATVRGTKWLVEDRCDGTLTKVFEGAVMVKDLKAKRRVLVKAGGRYLARTKR